MSWRKRQPAPQSELGEDVVEPPPRLTELPPNDRFCDLVLNGGVASGIVYPWAVLELARHYHFKNIGGTSVGAMAAALAAAAEYGRRTGHAEAFEVLRRVPGRLARELPQAGSGVTTLQALFQPEKAGRRLFGLFIRALNIFNRPFPKDPKWARWVQRWRMLQMAWAALWAYRREFALGAALGASLLLWLWTRAGQPAGWPGLGWCAVVAVSVGALGGLGLVLGIGSDIRRGIVDNGLGLCRGGDVAGSRPGGAALCRWLHEGIQRSAGLAPDDRALTFRDLWCAPAYPGAPRVPLADDAPAWQRSIQLEMLTSNVTLGRPFRLPLRDETSRLFFREHELAPYLTPVVMKALMEVARPYRPLNPKLDPQPDVHSRALYELPGADLPIVVAARLSLSFPVLFAAVPLYAIDYECVPGKLERCWFSDGGLCSNFPVHLFDAALPRWPTFGMWIGRRSPHHMDEPVWLPSWHTSGGGDTRMRFDPADSVGHRYRRNPKPPGHLGFLAGFLVSAVRTAKDWGDHTRMRLPHVRNRVARLGLVEGEGELNIAMSRRVLLEMASTYGTAAGKRFVAAYGAQADGKPARMWAEQRWVRLQVLLGGLRGYLGRCGLAAAQTAYTTDIGQAIADAAVEPPLHERDGSQEPLQPAQTAALQALLDAVLDLEKAIAAEQTVQPYRPRPGSELRLHPRL